MHVPERSDDESADVAQHSRHDDCRSKRSRLELAMAKKNLNIGLVGYGFMGRAHSNAFLQASRFFDLPYQPVLKAVCARNQDRVQSFADKWGYESIETDWRKLVDRKDIDLIDIASPNDTHAEIATAAANAGKM